MFPISQLRWSVLKHFLYIKGLVIVSSFPPRVSTGFITESAGISSLDFMKMGKNLKGI